MVILFSDKITIDDKLTQVTQVTEAKEPKRQTFERDI